MPDDMAPKKILPVDLGVSFTSHVWTRERGFERAAGRRVAERQQAEQIARIFDRRPDGALVERDAGLDPTTRGAIPVTIQARMSEDERLSNHATWRVPDDHPSAARLDQLLAKGYLDKILHANACSALRMWVESGLGRSQGIAAYLRTCRTTGDGDEDQRTAEDDVRRLERTGGVDFQAVIMLVRGDDMGAYMWERAKAGLRALDWLQARYPAERWSARANKGA